MMEDRETGGNFEKPTRRPPESQLFPVEEGGGKRSEGGDRKSSDPWRFDRSCTRLLIFRTGLI
jgi:hypothetical protein